MADTECTGLPWKVQEIDPGVFEVVSYTAGICHVILKTGNKANATFICLAVNSHTELVEALRFYADANNRGLKPMGEFAGGKVYGDALLMDNGEKARAALNKAKEGV